MKIRRLWPLLILLALTLLFFHQLAFSGLILARGDTYNYFYPYWAARNAAFMQGQLPLWSPDVFMGVPLLANPQLGTFYPLNWLLIPFAPPDGIRLSILVHTFWTLLGMYILAQTQLKATFPALVAAAVYGLGGYVGAHVEQINQLQGLAWLPWLFWLYGRALNRPRRYVPLLATALALQFFTGHTQTVFITGVGLGIYGLLNHNIQDTKSSSLIIIRALFILGVAGLLALSLILPQLLPSLELTSLSNRSGGLTFNEATSFSFNPFVIGRGLLPSYDGLLFGEYVAYGGVIGLGLALLGAVLPRMRQRWGWIGLAALGLILAFGEFNPLYQLLLRLPGFGFFRVPARWLALFALGVAMLAGYGLQRLQQVRLHRWHYGLIVGTIGSLALSSLLTARTPEAVIGPAVPTLTTWAGWGLALVLLLVAMRFGAKIVPLLLVIELFLASQFLPYNTLTLPETYQARRFTISQLLAYKNVDDAPPGRSLSISELLFDPGDKAALERRYADYHLSDLAVRHSLVATKLKEVLAPNQSLVWNLPSIDGFDGGLLPTKYYTAFSTLLLPADLEPTTDGRLREALALSECRGACIPDQRWLNLTNTRYLITDKVFDLWHEDVYYDTQITVSLAPDEFTTLANPIGFTADAVDVLYVGAGTPSVRFDDGELAPTDSGLLDAFTWQRYEAESALLPEQVTVQANGAVTLAAVTLVDTRTGAFIPLTLGDWQRQLSSDIKLYENQTVLPRAFMVYDVEFWVEDVIDYLSSPTFDPATMAILEGPGFTASEVGEYLTEITSYTPTHIEIEVDTDAAGYLLLTDAYYPGWQATVNGNPTPIQRANVMFRAVQLPAGEHTVVFTYQPYWLPGALWGGLLAWVITGIVTLVVWRRTG